MRRKLTEADKNYVQSHRLVLSVEEMAAELETTRKAVADYVESLPPPARTGDGFARYKGTVTMTAGQSMAEDEAEGRSPYQQEPAKPTLPERPKLPRTNLPPRTMRNIHVIRPDEPIS